MSQVATLPPSWQDSWTAPPVCPAERWRDDLVLDLSMGLYDSLLGLRRARGATERVAGRLLARIRDDRVHQSFGYRSFGDFCRERLELEPRTAQLQMQLGRIIDACPSLAEELVEGRLSACQVRELGPVVRFAMARSVARGGPPTGPASRVVAHEPLHESATAEPHDKTDSHEPPHGTPSTELDHWIVRAQQLTVRQLRAEVKKFVASQSSGESDRLGSPSSRGEDPPACDPCRAAEPGEVQLGSAPPGHAVEVDENSEDALVKLSISTPPATRVAWSRTVELARKVLGWNAPQPECFRAMLMEVGSDLIDGGATALSPTASAPPAHDSRVPRSAGREGARRGMGAEDSIVDDRHPGVGWERDDRVRWGAVRDGFVDLPEATLQSARTVLAQVRGELTHVDRLLDEMGSIDPVEGLEEIRLLDRPLTALFARALVAFRDVHGPSAFGYLDLESFALVELGMSERSVRSALGQVRLFERVPALEDAFVSSRVGMGKAMLVGRVTRLTGRAGAWIERAESITHRQLEREVRLRERLHDVDATLAWKHRDPWSAVELEADLWVRLAEVGVPRAEVEGQLAREGILVGDASAGGSCGRATASGKCFRAGACSCAATDGGDLDAGKCFGAGACSCAATDGGDLDAGKCFRMDSAATAEHAASAIDLAPALVDPATDPLLMRRIERLVDILALATCDDFLDLDRKGLMGRLDIGRDGMSSRVQMWLSEDVHADWCALCTTVRRRLGSVPDWVVLTLLLDHATRAWLEVDPERRPTEWKILERDDYSCQVPGCSSRSRLEVHHIIFRSRRGTNDPTNKVTLCHWHHHHGIHDGSVEVSGHAPGLLEWRLGRERPQRYHGDALLAGAIR